jgi:hypothetical protein
LRIHFAYFFNAYNREKDHGNLQIDRLKLAMSL